MLRIALLTLGTWTSVSFLLLSLLAIGALRTRGQRSGDDRALNLELLPPGS